MLELVWLWHRGASVKLDYALLYLALSVVIALMFGGVALFGGVAVALVTWTALNGAVVLRGSWGAIFLGAVALAVCAAVSLKRLRAEWIESGRVSVGGLVFAFALGTATLIVPRLLRDAGVPVSGWHRKVLIVALFGGVVALCALYEGLRRRWRPSPSLPAVVLVLTLLLPGVARLARTGPGEVSAGASATASGGAERPDILILVLDTVRADRLSLYGYPRETTPELDSFVERGRESVVYPSAFAPATWTVPSFSSLFTGVLPSDHRAHSADGGADLATSRYSISFSGPAAGPRTLAELASARGYRTALIYANRMLGRIDGIFDGFDYVTSPPIPRRLSFAADSVRGRLFPWLLASSVAPYPRAASVNREVLRVLESCDGPCFVVANYMEAHEPYAPPRRSGGVFSARSGWWPAPLDVRASDPTVTLRRASDRYDEEILGLDHEIGRLLRELERRGRLGNAWLVITSDHGESFGEHGAAVHGSSIYNEQVRVPLIIRPSRGSRLADPVGAVSLLDVTATISAVVGGPMLGIGRDLRDPAAEKAAPIEFFARDFTDRARYGRLATQPARAVVVGGTKLIDYLHRLELYHLPNDPSEQVDLAASRPEIAARLSRHLPPLRVNVPRDEGGGDETDPEERELLRSLGYVDE